MNNAETSLENMSLFKVMNHQRCMECGGPMKEAERRKEGIKTFVWYECVRADCDGQWLQSYKELTASRRLA